MAYIGRFLRISGALWGYLLWLGLLRLRLIRPRLTPADKLARVLERLGVTFIKLGQGLSLHRDLLPEAYVEALQSLQDKAVSFDGGLAVREVERALGRPAHELFAELDRRPLAAASIAQVHAARMPDGREVIVKVRRPGIKVQVAQDMRLLKLAVRLLVLLVPRWRCYQPLSIIDEIDINLRKEMDFRQEARNINRFVAAFEGSETVYIPRVVDGLYAESVLVQERSGGARVDDPAVRKNGPALARAFVDAYTKQFFVMGVFHGDPHPGNLFIMDDGRICFHDFGLVGFLDRATRRNLAAFMQAFVHQDSAWLLDAYLDMGWLGGELDRAAFQHGLEELFEDYASLPLKDWSFAEAFMRVTRMGWGQNIRVPHNLLVFMRAVFLIEAVVRSLDPEFNLLDSAVAKAERMMKETVQEQAAEAMKARLRYEAATAVQDLPETLGVWVRKLRTEGIQWRLYHQGLEEFERHIDRSSNRMSLALVSLGLYIAASLLVQADIGPRLGGIPFLAAVGYALALWFTFRLVIGISRSGRL